MSKGTPGDNYYMDFELIISRNCNLDCKYCFEKQKKRELMAIEQSQAIIDFIDSYVKNDFVFEKDYIHIDFNGGEPLLNERFIYNFIKLSKSLHKDFNYSLTTNGILINDELLELVRENDIHVQISLDGEKNIHDLNRTFYNGKGSFDLVFKKLLGIKKMGLDNNLIISLVFTPETVNKLSNNILFILNHGFHNITASICADYVWTDEKIKILKEQAKLLSNIYISFYERNISITISLFSNNIENTLLNFSKPICDAVSDYIAIVPSGNVLPCGGFVGCQNEDEIYIGNIYNGVEFNKLDFYIDKKNEDALNENHDCSKCSLLSRCQHNCFAINNRINKNLKKTCLPACLINQIFILESDKIINTMIENKNECFQKRYSSVFEKLEEKN